MDLPGYSHMVNCDEQAAEAVAALRFRYSRHLKDPQWQAFIDRLCAANSMFARLWDTQNVAPPRLCDKRYRFPGIGEINFRSTGMELTDHPGIRLVVLTAVDEDSRARVDEILRRASLYP